MTKKFVKQREMIEKLVIYAEPSNIASSVILFNSVGWTCPNVLKCSSSVILFNSVGWTCLNVLKCSSSVIFSNSVGWTCPNVLKCSSVTGALIKQPRGGERSLTFLSGKKLSKMWQTGLRRGCNKEAGRYSLTVARQLPAHPHSLTAARQHSLTATGLYSVTTARQHSLTAAR